MRDVECSPSGHPAEPWPDALGRGCAFSLSRPQSALVSWRTGKRLIGSSTMRNSLAILLFAALTVTAAGQAQRVDPKAPPKADAKKDPKAPARPEARMEQKSDPTTQSAGEWPSLVA